jgi:hypothetical protein
MRLAVFSDVHGNLPALERFVAATRREADGYVCLGDVVNYGPWNDECLHVVRSLPGCVLLEGNHERLFSGAESVEHELPLVRRFTEQSRRYFGRPEWIAGLPTEHRAGGFLFTHTLDGRRIYPDTPTDVRECCFIGHTHHQFRRDCPGGVLINCGSVGQNRRQLDVIHYCLFDTDSGAVELCRESYDAELFVGELEVRGYPLECLGYFRSKLARAA